MFIDTNTIKKISASISFAVTTCFNYYIFCNYLPIFWAAPFLAVAYRIDNKEA